MRVPILILVLLLSLCSSAAKPDQLITVAVFDFASKEQADDPTAFSAVLTAVLSAEENLALLERAELEKAFGEIELGLSGTVAEDTSARLGQMLGAKVLVTGRLLKAGDERIAIAKVIGTETTRVHALMAKGRVDGSMTDLATDLAGKIAEAIRSRTDTFLSKPKTREERLAAIRQLVKESPKPSVAIQIPEQHFGAPVIDPAAETELGLIFRECGFLVIDWEKRSEADVQLTGEAFSAFGMRRGALWICKSRIEIKANRTDGDSSVLMDRQMGVAGDLTEQTAAKLALQNAAFDLAARLLPELVRAQP